MACALKPAFRAQQLKARIHTAHSVATRIFLSLSTPRLVDGRPQQVGFLARGLESLVTFPDFFNPVVFEEGTPLTVAGAARAFHPSSLKSPYGGTYRVRIR